MLCSSLSLLILCFQKVYFIKNNLPFFALFDLILCFYYWHSIIFENFVGFFFLSIIYSGALYSDVRNGCTGPSQSRTSRLLHLVPQIEAVAWWEQLSVPALQFLYLKVKYGRY